MSKLFLLLCLVCGGALQAENLFAGFDVKDWKIKKPVSTIKLNLFTKREQ